MFDSNISPLLVFVISFFACFIIVPAIFGLLRILGVYTIVEEGKCHVYVLFGRVEAVIDEPGLHILLLKLGLKAPIVRWLGKLYVLDMRIDQQYLRSQPVNSEEGAPMGIGIWYEMFISDAVNFLFKNADPRGSLAANVSNSTVRCLSNMKLADMLQTRHAMSQTVRAEVSPQSHEWGYKLGSVYIRKVHFRDKEMIRQIEGSQPAAPGDLVHQAGRRQPGQYHYKHRRKTGRRRICQGGGDAAANRGRGAQPGGSRSRSGSCHVRGSGNPEDGRKQSPDYAGARTKRHSAGIAGLREPLGGGRAFAGGRITIEIRSMTARQYHI
jgi:hypothetical protein